MQPQYTFYNGKFPVYNLVSVPSLALAFVKHRRFSLDWAVFVNFVLFSRGEPPARRGHEYHPNLFFWTLKLFFWTVQADNFLEIGEVLFSQ